ncbi:MAG: hypothetical protein WC637_02590 [Victivallales bacterium]
MFLNCKHHGKFPLLNVLFDERRAHSGCDIPVNVPDIVFRGVFAHLVELDAAPLEHAVIGACGDVVDNTPGPYFDPSDLRNYVLCIDHFIRLICFATRDS